MPERMEEGAAAEAAARAIRRHIPSVLVGPTQRFSEKLATAALDAISYPALLAELTRLRDRIDEILPPLTPDFQAIMERLDAEVERLAAYENSETGKMSTPAASRSRTLEIIHTARHLVRYANDAEAGNAALLAELRRQAAVVEAARDVVLYDALYEENCGGNCDGCKLTAALAALDTP